VLKKIAIMQISEGTQSSLSLKNRKRFFKL